MKKHTNDRPGTPGKKLALDKVTLRILGSKDLGQVVGGAEPTTNNSSCA